MNQFNNLGPKKISIGKLFFFVMTAFLIIYVFFGSRPASLMMKYSDFLSACESGTVKEVTIIDQSVICAKVLSTGGILSTVNVYIPYLDNSLLTLLKDNDIIISGKKAESGVLSKIFEFLPTIMLVVIFLVILRQNNMQNEGNFQFGRSRAKVYSKKDNHVTFDDVAGQKEAKEELAEIVDFLKNKKKYIELGAKIPKGVLLVGNPGTGKTLLAKAVAGEADVPFLHISGSDFVEMFVGVGASRVRDLFNQARKLSPAIIFIDEIDAVGRARGTGLGGGHDEREQTLNQILVEMDGFEPSSGVIVLAATNRSDVLDPALLRPGRFDRQVTVNLPDVKEREAILNVHAKNVKLEDNIDIQKIARATPGMSGADLANIINEAAILAARNNKTKITDSELEMAHDKVLMGLAKNSLVLPQKEKEMTASHEAGHALMHYHLKHADPLHKVTIIPRGRALGVTFGLPKEDSYSKTKSYLMDQLIILFGGYAAETVLYNETTTGASNDLQRATDLARRIVCEFGMDETIGPVTYGEEDTPIFMGKEINRHKMFSEYTAKEIDIAVKNILVKAKNDAIDILEKNKEQLITLTQGLLEKETLSDSEVRNLLKMEQ